ncbi:motility protein A [Loktanella agnita]|uniref:motility protein A n=1 Tax=Loktanella agnita TaxID=287097 RepID=UPI003988993C
MRIWSIVGLLVGFTMLAIAVGLTAQDPMMFVNIPGFALVLGGTFAATLTSYSLQEIWAAIRALAMHNGSDGNLEHAGLRDIMHIAKVMDAKGARAAEVAIKRVRSPFLQTGLQLVIDEVPSRQLIEVTDWRIARIRAHGRAQADVFNVMSIYAPAFGMVGTLLGLVNMLRGIGGDITEIGISLSLALVTTFYGIVMANAVFKPFAVTLQRQVEDRMAVLSVAQEALVLLADHHSPVQLKYSISSYVDPQDVDLIEQPSGGEPKDAPRA